MGDICLHVDDLLIAGRSSSPRWKEFRPHLKTLEQNDDFNFTLTQESFVLGFLLLMLPMDRRQVPNAPTTKAEVTGIRRILAAACWRANHCDPHLLAMAHEVQTEQKRATVATVQRTKKLLRKMQPSKRGCLSESSPFGTASPSSRGATPPKPGTRPGTCDDGRRGHPERRRGPLQHDLSWTSMRLAHVARSTESAKSQAAAEALDELYWCRLAWGKLGGRAVLDLQASGEAHPHLARPASARRSRCSASANC